MHIISKGCNLFATLHLSHLSDVSTHFHQAQHQVVRADAS